MAELVRMPKMSDTMEEGAIATWHKKVGDKIEEGEVIAEVETDKATMEFESFEEGTLLHIAAQEKESVPVNGPIAIVGEEGEDVSDLVKQVEDEKAGKSNGTPAATAEEKADTQQSSPEDGSPAAEAPDVSDINASVITMPKLSDTMETGKIVSWQKKVGDKVDEGEILAEVETDKATMEMEAFEEGTLLHIEAEEGTEVKVNDIIAVVGEEGADVDALLKAYRSGGSSDKKEGKQEAAPQKEKAPAKEEKAAAPAPETKTPAPQSGTADPQASNTTPEGRIKASPLARRMAEEKGIDLSKVTGTGENGRIVKRDIENYQPEAEPAAASASEAGGVTAPQVVGEESYEEVSVSQMRKTIAKRLSASKFDAPHFYLTMEIDMDRAIEARKSLNEVSPVKISFNDMVIKAVAASLRQHPKVNSSWLGDRIRFNHHIHIGVAVAVEEGLLVPVVRFADNKQLSQIASEVKDLAKKAQNKELQPQDWEGNTFTISNLGMYGIEEFTAIINPPDACILAIGGVQQKPVVKDGEVKPGNVMKVTLSCDHRVVDGAVGSAFLSTLKGMLEEPVRIMV